MKYNKEQEITIDNRKLYVLSSIIYGGKNYIYAQEIDEEEDDLKMSYFIYEAGINDTMVTDEILINELLKKFSEDIKERL